MEIGLGCDLGVLALSGAALMNCSNWESWHFGFSQINCVKHSNESSLSSQEFLHHALLEGAGLFTPLLQGGQLRVHVGENGGDGGLFGEVCGNGKREREKGCLLHVGQSPIQLVAP